MKKSFLIIILLSTLISCDQGNINSDFNKIEITQEIKNELFNSSEFILNPLTIKTEKGYDNLIDSTLYLIRSNLEVNNDKSRKMRFTSLTKRNKDTLLLEIYETNAEYHQILTIKIVNDYFKSNFDYEVSGLIMNTNIETVEQNLMVTQIPKKSGEKMNGRLYYKGLCKSDCKGEIEISGYFKAQLE